MTPTAQQLGALAAAVVLAGCLPEGSPPWLVDHPIAAALRVDVAERGPYGAEPPRAGTVIAQVMPGDAIRATPFIVGPDGPADLEALRPAWFYCPLSACFGALTGGDDLRPCGAEPVPPEDTCSLGAGPEGRLQLGELISFNYGRVPALFMVSGTPGGLSTQECLQRLRGLRARAESLEECLMMIEPLPLGPAWRVVILAAFLGLPDALPPSVIPADALTSEPNVFPRIEPFELAITGLDGEVREQVAVDRDTIAVRPGELVEIVAPLDPADAQFYVDALVRNGQLNPFTAAFEVMSSSWLFSREVGFAISEPQVIEWRVPADATGAIHAYYLLSDTRAIVWAWLRFEVEAP